MDAMKDGNPIPVADLIAHTGWLRSLARGLVSDEALAEDLVQESLLRAVKRPPRRPGALGSWLRTVLSRLAISARREREGRERRERAAARRERSDSTPADVLERVEFQRQAVDLVLALDEPLRSAVLLRYFEDRSAEEIASLQRVYASTVRWRLRKAIERLRERLDRLHGSRAGWCAVLAPLLWADRVAEAAGPSAGPEVAGFSSAPLAARWVHLGVAIMKLKTVAISVVVSLLLLGLCFTLAWRRGVEPVAQPPAAPTASATVPVAAPPALPLEPAGPPAGQTPAPDLSPLPAPRGGAEIEGLVNDRGSGDPIPGAVVRVRGVRVRGDEVRAVAGEDGAYRLDGLPAGEHYLVAGAVGHAEEHARAHLEEGKSFLQDFRLEPAIELLVTVVDVDGKPIEGVRLTAAQPAGNYDYGEEYSKLTGGDGKALLSGIGRERKQQVNARKEGYQEVWTRDYEIDPESDRAELSIVMNGRPRGDAVVVGLVTGPKGEPLAGIHVQWIHSHGEQRGRAVVETSRDGSYRLDFPRSGDWCAVSAFGEGFAPSIREGVRPGNDEEPARVDFSLLAGHWLEGVVVDEADRSVAGAVVVALPTIWNLRNAPLHPGNASRARTDDRGRFYLQDLAAPTTALRIRGPEGTDWANNYNPKVEVDRRVTLRLLRWGVVLGRVLDRETGKPVQVFGIKLKKGVGYYDYARSDPGEFFNSPEGFFVLKQLDQGPIEFLLEAEGYIAKWVRDFSVEPEERGGIREVRITRGRFLEGLVLDAASGAPLSDARVVFGAWGEGDLAWDEEAFRKMADRQEVRTGSDGLFRVREGDPGTLLVHRGGYARVAVPALMREGLLDASGRLRVALEPGASLRGVMYEDGKPSKRGFLVLYRRGPEAGAAGREWFGNIDRDDGGRFRVEDLPGGEYCLEHWRETPAKQTAGLSIQRALRIEAGKESVLDFGADLGSFAFLGRVVRPDGNPCDGVRLVLRPEFEWGYSEFSASVSAEHEGRFHFLGLRPGKYRAAISDRAGRTKVLPPVEIEADLEQDITAPSFSAQEMAR